MVSIFWFLSSLILISCAQSIKDDDDKQIENENHRESRSMVSLSKSGLTPLKYFQTVLATHECPRKSVRADLNFKARKVFSCAMKPKSSVKNKGKAFYALYGAPQHLTLYGPKKTRFIVKSKKYKFVYLRRFCAWNFMVTKVTVKMYYKKKLQTVQGWVPKVNDLWFRFGCTENDWIKVDLIEVLLGHNTNTHFHLKDVFAEMCIPKDS